MPDDSLPLRPAVPEDLEPLAALWHQGVHAAHAGLIPDALLALRTRESMRERLVPMLPRTTVAGPVGAPVGFCTIHDDELNQLYVAPAAQGRGVAMRLMADAEDRLRAGGHVVAWLACAVGNDRAVRFYEKCGWRRAGTMTYGAETSSGPFPVETWRIEKRLEGRAG